MTLTPGQIETEAAIYAEGTQYTREDLMTAWRSLTAKQQAETTCQRFFERFVADSPAAKIRVVLWHGTTQETHLADSYAAAIDLVDERHHNAHEPAFYDASTGERLYDGGYGLATEAGEIRFA